MLCRAGPPDPAADQEPGLESRSGGRPARKPILAFVGVQTGFTTSPLPKYNYEARRLALRSSWFPGSKQELERLEREHGIVARFVIGQSADPAAEAALAADAAAHADFLRLEGLVEGYAGLPTKTLTFLRAVTQRYDPQYIVKVDDDVYLRLDRVPAAVAQWRQAQADYLGCFKTGAIVKSPKWRWYEPQHVLLGGASYFAHTWGSAYVVSGRAAADLAAQRPGSLRQFANEDVTIGAWMLAFNTTPFDDRRMCEPACSNSSIAVYDFPKCAGLCEPAEQLLQLHASPACHAPALDAEGQLPRLPPILRFDAGPEEAVAAVAAHDAAEHSASGPVAAFKAEEFKKCADSAFCMRLRNVTSETFVVLPESVAVEGARVTATVANSADANGTFRLVLTAYGNTLRLFIDEGADKGRFQVPDVLLPGLEAREQPWEVVKRSHTKLRVRCGAAEAELRMKPVAQLELSVGGAPVALWNGNKHFVFEHLREKQEGDPDGWWAENFKSHHDSKPKGPTGISFDLQFPGSRHLYGLPERASHLALRPTRGTDGEPLSEPYRLYNLDVFEYLHDSPFGLYGSIPLLMAHRAGQTIGAFWLNSAEMFVDVEQGAAGAGTQWFAESGVLDLFFLLGPKPADVASQFAALTGGTALPQMFSLGYHQCRWNYKDEADVAAVDGGFDTHNIPYDVLWLDIEHTNGKRYFTWDEAYFPTPARMQEDLASRGRKMVTIVDPHIKRDPAWRLFKEAEEKGLYVKNKEGGDFDGWCWPGSSSYLDMVSPAVRDWWAQQFSTKVYEGSTKSLYIWNDMNEPSVFNGPEITMHKDNLHYKDAEHRDVHNVYGYFYHMATADGLRKRGFEEWGPDGDRPFVLSRAFYAGTQRIGAIWTGDNEASWEHLRVSVPMLLAINVAGLPFSGADIGGFFGNPEPELLVRWYQVAAFYPFMRGHAHLEAKRREPWLFGEDNTSRIRDAIRQRYALLPYLYTQFLAANASGAPIMRPLFYEFPEEAGIFETQHTFMLGPSLLVAPVLDEGATEVPVVLPGGGMWYDNLDGTAIDGDMEANKSFSAPVTMEHIRSYLRGGTMLTLKERPRRSTTQMVTDPITLVIALDKAGTARGELYLDDGRSYAFQRGAYTYRSFSFSADGLLSSVAADHSAAQLAPPQPDYNPETSIDRIVVLGLPDGPAGWGVAVEGAGARQLDAAPGPLYLKEGLADVALVVRRAGLPAQGDWSLRLARTAGGGGSLLLRNDDVLFPSFKGRDLASKGIEARLVERARDGATAADLEAQLRGLEVAPEPAIALVTVGGNDLLQGLDADPSGQGVKRLAAGVESFLQRLPIRPVLLGNVPSLPPPKAATACAVGGVEYAVCKTFSAGFVGATTTVHHLRSGSNMRVALRSASTGWAAWAKSPGGMINSEAFFVHPGSGDGLAFTAATLAGYYGPSVATCWRPFTVEWPAGASESVTVLVGTGGFGGSSFYKHSKTPQSLLVTLAGAS
ncbi:putative glucan 1,3-alpha-glucosidase [Micractinium conductrix]|uniref:Glucosidase II subunit alpha n=1 Tax=Micractinium conductrix TaxID=554055 RepID=A0A2P6V2C9_9CHLO|nr:putative glucan 1,3-alpha-glucosidase [Micractinium conductrix]|eukprot:PSC68247.1 putative glucan 1,3-alpha-glucosidase [Micractinium conductrix]